jgi:geranylgeranyl pyrophosphate synthase
LYNDFVETGVLNESATILQTLDTSYRAPIVHTLSTHVTKEKSQMTYHLGKQFGKSDRESRIMASSIDLLWSFSLIYDDIFDGDSSRAEISTAWKKFGETNAMSAIENEYSTLLQMLDSAFGANVVALTKKYVEEGVESLKEHTTLSFSSSIEDIIRNYNKRSKFHTDLPIDVFASENQEAQKIKLGLQQINMAGQILNDVKDLMPPEISGRQNLSDIRGGFITLPLKLLWEYFDESEKKTMEDLLGKANLSTNQEEFIMNLLGKYPMLQDIHFIATELYLSSDRIFSSIIKDDLALKLFRGWVFYKLQQLDNMESSLK